MLTSWEHVVCPLSGIKKRPLMGGWFTTSFIVNSIGAIASVRYREIVRWREGPLWEVPLYTAMAVHTIVAATALREHLSGAAQHPWSAPLGCQTALQKQIC